MANISTRYHSDSYISPSTTWSVVTDPSLIGVTSTSITTDLWTVTLTDASSPTTFVDVTNLTTIFVTVWVDATSCKSYQVPRFHNWIAATLQPNPDISGIGVIAAFLVTAWLVVGFLLWAYWFGLLPSSHLSLADRKCFAVNSRRCTSEWRETLEKVVITFSDQQLITGLAILICGFYEMFFDELDSMHWFIVTYLAWMSSTVHLITLSLLGEKLLENRGLCYVRVAGMTILVALVATALSTQAYVDLTNFNFFKIPAKCGLEGFFYSDTDTASLAISYITLLGGYVFGVSRLFPSSSTMVSKILRAHPQAFLERSAKSCLAKKANGKSGAGFQFWILTYTYLLFTLWVESFRSFAGTITTLLFTLVLGTSNLLYGCIYVLYMLQPVERKLSFGQLLPLMLLIQPCLAAGEHFLKNPRSMRFSPSASNPASASSQSPNTWLSLSDVLQHAPLLTAEQKASNREDPVLEFLYSTKPFKDLTKTFLSFVVVLMVEILVSTFFPWGVALWLRFLIIMWSVATLFGFLIPLAVCIAQLSHRKLR